MEVSVNAERAFWKCRNSEYSAMKDFATAGLNLSAIRDRLMHHPWFIVLLIGMALMGGLTLVSTAPAMMQPDSPSYLDWSVSRTPGYPLFLSILRMIDPELRVLPYVQMATLIASSAFLVHVIARLGVPWWLWVLVSAGIVGNPFIWSYAGEIMTESLYITLFMVFLGCIGIALQRQPAVPWLIAASGVLGAAILVRPAGYALLGVVPCIALLWTDRRWRAIGSALTPAIAILLVISGWNLANNGFFGTQLFDGYNVGKYHRSLKETPLADVAGDITAPSPDAIAKQGSALTWSYAIATIEQRPADYIFRVLAKFSELWTWRDISSAENARIRIPRVAVLLKSALFFTLMVISFTIVVLIPLAHRSLLLEFSAVAALCINANHFLVALLEDALPRYAMVMWPALLAMMATFASWLSRRKSLESRGSSPQTSLRKSGYPRPLAE